MFYSTEEAEQLISNGFICNGCGNRKWNILLALTLQWWARVDFSEACKRHDAERNIKVKSEEHRLRSDADFMLNLIICCERIKIKKHSNRARKVARMFHWAVVVNSYDTYYEPRQKEYKNV